MANPVPRAARMPPASRRAALATWCMLLRRRSRARGRCVDLPDASLKDSAVGPWDAILRPASSLLQSSMASSFDEAGVIVMAELSLTSVAQ
uniref:Putative secreted protein n=1 Tax=Ixodes ricinus TaxID=34613 RepID=A0A6B0UB20_IXORI